MFVLFNFIIAFALGVVDGLCGWVSPEVGLGALGGIYTLAVFIPGLAVAVRRLHDIGKSGWNLLLGIIPLVGAIVLLVWFCRDGERMSNAWGANPKNAED